MAEKIIVRGKGARGPKGDQGIQGPQGPQGERGPAGSILNFDQTLVSFVYEKRSNAITWTIAHGLRFHPNVTVIDYGQNNVECDIEHVDQNTLILTFSEAVSGFAYLS
jgi:hypothetical protein